MLPRAPVALAFAFCGLACAYPSFMVDPNLKGVEDWKRAAAEIKAGKYAELDARQATPTRGSDPNPTDPCYNVFLYPSPTANATAPGPDGSPNHGYVPPGSNDVRAPCPGLNTLANHGYLPRNGRGITGNDLIGAFISGFGIDESVITNAKTNALATCTYQSDGEENDNFSVGCEAFDLNALNTPHVFEHDHSLSRNDYEESWVNAPANNHVFNGTLFNATLLPLENSCYMTVQQAQQVRLQREVDQFLIDKPGWFTLATGSMLTEIGFIFAVMSETNQPGGAGDVNDASVRVDWWQYWFMYESFPTDLGWQVPSPLVQGSFVASISSMIEAATITSTPSPFFTEFVIGPTGAFPSTSQSGTQFFNPSIPNMYTTIMTGLVERDFVEATPTPVVPLSDFAVKARATAV